MNYIGIDVSKQELSAFDGEQEVTVKNEKGLGKLKAYMKKRFKKFDDVVIIFESTGTYSDNLKEFCNIQKINAFIVNPKKSSNFAKAIGNRSKTDRIDAKMLYEFKNIININDIAIPEIDEVAEKLLSYLTSYEFSSKKVTSIINHIEALNHKNNVPKDLLLMLKKELKAAKKLQYKIMLKMTEYVESNQELKDNYNNLLTISGVGKISALALLTIFTKYKNTNRTQITALAGLDPIRKESGTSVNGRKRISKGGNKIFRKILYFPMLSAIRYNENIKRFYDRLVEKHKSKKSAVIASMRKLLLIAHAMYKNKTVFCEEL